MSLPKVSVILCTTEYRGDHSTDLLLPCTLKEGETVEQLAERLLTDEKEGARFVDKIEIRLVQP
jgi:hypothetical protein